MVLTKVQVAGGNGVGAELGAKENSGCNHPHDHGDEEAESIDESAARQNARCNGLLACREMRLQPRNLAANAVSNIPQAW